MLEALAASGGKSASIAAKKRSRLRSAEAQGRARAVFADVARDDKRRDCAGARPGDPGAAGSAGAANAGAGALQVLVLAMAPLLVLLLVYVLALVLAELHLQTIIPTPSTSRAWPNSRPFKSPLAPSAFRAPS